MSTDTIQCVSEVIREANQQASLQGRWVGVCWNQGEARWETYSLLEGTDHKPEFICYGTGRIPQALTEDAMNSFRSLILSRLTN